MHPVDDRLRRLFSLRALRTQCLCYAVTALLCSAPQNAAGEDRASSLRGSINALDSARRTALGELDTLPETTREKGDYRDFIVYLNTRIVAYCMELAEHGGGAALEGLPCPSASAEGATGTPTVAAETTFNAPGSTAVEARTRAEQTAELDGELLAALGDFDDMLLQEEGRIAARVPRQRVSSNSSQAAASSSGGTSGEAGEFSAASSGDEGDQNGGTNAGETAEGGGSAGSGPGAHPGAQGSAGAGSSTKASRDGVPGGKLPPPEDDDIVARQLREAADKESDPELKKKLWEEYWKYKGRRG